MPRPRHPSDSIYRYRSTKARGRKWKAWEETALRQLYGRISAEAIGALLKRKPVSVNQRASHMRLEKGAK